MSENSLRTGLDYGVLTKRCVHLAVGPLQTQGLYQTAVNTNTGEGVNQTTCIQTQGMNQTTCIQTQGMNQTTVNTNQSNDALRAVELYVN